MINNIVKILGEDAQYRLAFAGGAMLFVISEEIIPETHSRGNDREATIGIMAGFIIMMVLDNIFG